jgi:hypothetical protein
MSKVEDLDDYRRKHLTAPQTSYREIKIGRTLYRVTSVFSGEKDLKQVLEKLAIEKVLCDLNEKAAQKHCA